MEEVYRTKCWGEGHRASFLWVDHPPSVLTCSPIQKPSKPCYLGVLMKVSLRGHNWPLLIRLSLQLLHPPQRMGVGAESSSPLILPWFFWRLVPILKLSRDPAICPLISIQKTLITLEIPRVLGAVCQNQGQRPNISYRGTPRLCCLLSVSCQAHPLTFHCLSLFIRTMWKIIGPLLQVRSKD